MKSDQAPRKAAALRARHLTSGSAMNALTQGTTVLTLDGALPVEYLSPGDRVISRTAGVARLLAIRPMRCNVNAISIAASTLGNARPDQDVVLCADQEVLIRDWRASALFGASQALVPAQRLVDGTYIQDLGEQDLQLFTLVFDSPQIIYADGMELAAAVGETVDA